MLKYYVSLQWRQAAAVAAQNEKQLQEAIAESLKTAPKGEAAEAGDGAAVESEKEKAEEQDKE